jgi:hypothetical protein
LLSALATAGAVRAMEDVSPDDSWKGKVLRGGALHVESS